MILSPSTISILGSFAGISAGIIIPSGNTLSVVSASRDVFATAQVEEYFPEEVCFYNLAEFLSLVKILKTPELKVFKNHVVLSQGKYTVTYAYGNTELVPRPPAAFNAPEPIAIHRIPESEWNTIQNLASTLKEDSISFGLDEHNGKSSFFVVTGGGRSSIGVYRAPPDQPFSEEHTKVKVKSTLFSVLKDDYIITLYKGGRILKMEGEHNKVTYYFAGEI